MLNVQPSIFPHLWAVITFLITCIPRVASAFYWLFSCGSVSSIWSSGYQMSSCFGLRTVCECWGVGALWPSHCPCPTEMSGQDASRCCIRWTGDRLEGLSFQRWPLALIPFLFWNHFGFFRIPSRGFQILMYLKITQGGVINIIAFGAPVLEIVIHCSRIAWNPAVWT